MKFLQYFIYLAYNWNVRIAFHIIKQEITGEQKYGINTTGADDLKRFEKQGNDISNATIYMPAPYDMLEMFFEKANLKNCKHFVDIGCGKGRAMIVAAHFGAKKITGLDFSKELIMATNENLNQLKAPFPSVQYQTFCNDAYYFKIENDVDCIFMFNPFNEVIMSGVLQNIEDSLLANPRKIQIIYLNPVEKQVLYEWGYKQIFTFKKLTYLEGSIFEKTL
jgi:SAM-dependent methyltransferase